MKVLAINCGSSTLKFTFVEAREGNNPASSWTRIAEGKIDKIGLKSNLAFNSVNQVGLEKEIGISDHGEAIKTVIHWLKSEDLLANNEPSAVGHRVVHGGNKFQKPILINEKVIEEIAQISQLAPLHNEPSLMAIRVSRELIGSRIPMVAVFDTAFHSNMPIQSSIYAIPHELSERHAIRRYGFHGLAHQYMCERYAAITSTPIEQAKLITLQLGNGCSAAAVKDGYSLDTSMGFTPLEGLMMGTRCGDLDPSLPGFIAASEGIDITEVEIILNTRSGLLGVSGYSQDVRDLVTEVEQKDTRAILSLDMFCYRIKKYIGAYLAVLGGADALIFGGGIGENVPLIRQRSCEGMQWCGLSIDNKRNTSAIQHEEQISANDSRVAIYVIPVDESSIIVRDTINCLRSTLHA